MEFDVTWILLGLPITFLLGWMASRLDLRQWRLENRHAPKAYFKGLNFLLNEQQDQAIDAFIEAVQNDPDTSELHFALGNLFRRRAEYERAVRVHQHLLSRSDLNNADRARAHYALALDYLKAGLLDRAENTLCLLQGTEFENQANLALLSIYERTREWARAAEIAQALERAGVGSYASRQAHYLCEQALAQKKTHQFDEACRLLSQAIKIAPDSARAYIELVQVHKTQQRFDVACDVLTQLVQYAPTHLPLVVQIWLECAQHTQRQQQVRVLLQESYDQNPGVDILDALVQLDIDSGMPPPQAQQRYIEHLRQHPSLVAATHWMASAQLVQTQAHEPIQRALEYAVKPLTRYRCAACGFEAKHYFWQCPGCQSWDSYPPQRVAEL